MLNLSSVTYQGPLQVKLGNPGNWMRWRSVLLWAVNPSKGQGRSAKNDGLGFTAIDLQPFFLAGTELALFRPLVICDV